ncbi:hypothetical protein [Marinobacter salarius]|uniref:hypothetical protein n=1 Tax=Marinobacter salarius TaxID=1420917 RepID=UPI00241C1013|nr:hypothetical protein [Marinobacter salarius]
MAKRNDPARKPPSMKRSQGQLANAYAPGAFFTFEGGRGACMSRVNPSAPGHEMILQREHQQQVIARLNEALRSWLDRARAARGGVEPDNLCMDDALLKDGQLELPPIDSLVFLRPDTVTYEPMPLAFVCRHCKRFEHFESIRELDRKKHRLNGECTAYEGDCHWRQLDVVFVSHTGEVEVPQPGRYTWSQSAEEVQRWHKTCEHCHGDRFCLDISSSQIGKWYFYCATPGCIGQRSHRHWHQYSYYLSGHYQDQAGSHPNECRMVPVSYRASMVHYAQMERFVLVPTSQQKLLNIINSSNRELMHEFLAKRFRYPGEEYSEEEIRERLEQAGMSKDWNKYKSLLVSAEGMDQETARDLRSIAQDMLDSFTQGDSPILESRFELPDAVRLGVASRDEFTGRFDPFVLAVEHEALERGKLKVGDAGDKQTFVRFTAMDNDLSPKNPTKKAAQEKETQRIIGQMGIDDIGLIREFDLCQFTYGYSRLGSGPQAEVGSETYPTKLRVFDRVRTEDGPRRPIYVITQANEAIYVRLNPSSVYAWLEQMDLVDLPSWTPGGIDIGGKILEVAQPFGRFFSLLNPGPASTYRYVYTLLHTYAHVLMKAVSENSGLDLSSLSEYIFPADLAFVVYRNGTTMDLGNLSALWRNENNSFLERLTDPKMNRCNSGQLCPGACPDCITIPETSCIASNNLLSRSTLVGGKAPAFDQTHANQRIPGFFEVLLDAVE